MCLNVFFLSPIFYNLKVIMGVIDELKSEKNIGLIIIATEKMLKDKYNNLNVDRNELIYVVNNMINNICADTILTKNVFVLMELNKITLSKIKDYYDNIINKMEVEASLNNNNQVVPENYKESTTDVGDFGDSMKYDSEQLLLKVLELEEKRNNLALLQKNNTTNASNASNASNTSNASNATNAANASNASNTNNTSNTNNIMLHQDNINLKVLELLNINNNKNKQKNIIINSYNRDWINNPYRNKLSFNINIDLSIHNIKISKILLPVNVKNNTPYINLIINDGKLNQKIIYVLANNNDNNTWDTWEPVNDDYVLLTNKNWHINFTDFLNRDLEMGRDNIDIIEVVEKDTEYNKEKYDIVINNTNDIEYNNFGMKLLKPYDNILIKTNTGENIISKITNIHDNTISICSKNIEKKTLINSTLLNYKSQFSIIMSYYHKL